MNNKRLDIAKLLQAESTEDAIREQGFPKGSLDDAEIAFISTLAATERESSRVLNAPRGQEMGKKLPSE
ncbi:MAG: hypothetical protein KME16_02910 [Scytolyngbya sp. HA4215-MV1]|nr:hypothetical protein [Scytolyngbya sp. HA4215-MV1]